MEKVIALTFAGIALLGLVCMAVNGAIWWIVATTFKERTLVLAIIVLSSVFVMFISASVGAYKGEE